MKFYLGTHHDSWIGREDVGAPLFVSRRRLARRKKLPRAQTDWALDSGGFSELTLHGRWSISTEQYAREIMRYDDEIGRMDWAASMDMMCEPFMLERTGMTVQQHQEITIDQYIDLRNRVPDRIHVMPVLQGWEVEDYVRHAEQYEKRGVELVGMSVVGVGSVCRRQATDVVERIARALPEIQMHGFGVKLKGVRNAVEYLKSSDSMAWSYSARREPALCGCTHANCANCLRYAKLWYQRMMVSIETQKGVSRGYVQATFRDW